MRSRVKEFLRFKKRDARVNPDWRSLCAVAGSRWSYRRAAIAPVDAQIGIAKFTAMLQVLWEFRESLRRMLFQIEAGAPPMGTFGSMRLCGNRAKVAAWSNRHRCEARL
ncbi:MAG: hypothetical protein JO307_02915 [Bryobacterales bacterium]|nr:hypothetical protein [Bryobacterales bacterium]